MIPYLRCFLSGEGGITHTVGSVSCFLQRNSGLEVLQGRGKVWLVSTELWRWWADGERKVNPLRDERPEMGARLGMAFGQRAEPG